MYDPRMKTILHTGNKTFESAMVDAIITLFVRNSDKISAYKFDGNKKYNTYEFRSI